MGDFRLERLAGPQYCATRGQLPNHEVCGFEQIQKRKKEQIGETSQFGLPRIRMGASRVERLRLFTVTDVYIRSSHT